MVVSDKIYKVLSKFFIAITVEVKFAFIQMGFRVDIAMTQKKQFFLVTQFWKLLVDFYRFYVKVVIVSTMPDILAIKTSDWVFLATSIIGFAILSGGISEQGC